MVKFSKQFEGQLIPEWRAAFVDYRKLKKDVKKIDISPGDPNSQARGENSLPYFLQKFYCMNSKQENLIRVHARPASLDRMEDWYQTELLQHLADNGTAGEFFACMDSQLNKVNQFYRMKETELVDRGESLKKQLHILLQLTREVAGGESSHENSEDSSISCSISSDESEIKEKSPAKDTEKGRGMALSDHVISFHGRNLRIKIPLTNPSRTFSAIGFLLMEDFANASFSNYEGRKLRINRTKLHQAEKMVREAFLELYRGLGYLKTYRHLNLLAFVKILKKLDKITTKEIMPQYLRVVESSYFNTSDKVVKLADEVEELFIKHFADADKRKAMKYLKPHQQQDTHCTTFFIGLFAGCFIALLAGYIILAHIEGMYKNQADTLYMETVYPVLSVFSLLFLHLFLYGCNIFTWRRTRINYAFIFELKHTKKLNYRDIFLICATSMSVIVGILFVHLLLIQKGYSSIQVQAIPGVLLLAFLMLLLCPFKIFFHASRSCFLRVIRNITISPLYKVVMLDFFMADQLCSQVPLLRNLEYVACYYITGSYATQDYGYCMKKKNYRDLAYAVSFLPYYWRAMQCARRWFDEGEWSHLANLGKYVSAMVAAAVRVTYENERSQGWLFLVVLTSSIATVYQLYWDYVKDWGLFQPLSKNALLRNDLILREKMIYYVSMVLNLILRLAWLQSVLHSNIEGVDSRVTGLLLAALEVVRRAQWNFYRLENEHLNNAGKFRAVKTVPLPFHEVGEE